ncbi:MAG: flagellar biosynthetic protein FliR [Rhodopila sp.]
MDWASLLDWAPAFALVLARVGAAMALLPGLGESAAPAMMRIGMALGLTILLLPGVQPLTPKIPEAGAEMALMVAGEVVIGLWFGWVARMIALALPIGAQFIAYMIGLSTLLQPDAELGSQATPLGKLFELAPPLLILVSGLYVLPLQALGGLFALIPPGRMLPTGDGVQVVLQSVASAFALALQLASPFVVAGIIWNIAIGQIARVGGRMQIYFVAMPAQILGGLALLALTGSAILLAWRERAESVLSQLPGSS